MIVGGAKTVPQSPEAGSASSTLHSVESSPSMFRMPARAPDQKDWTPDDSSASCEECRALFSLVSVSSCYSLMYCYAYFMPMTY